MAVGERNGADRRRSGHGAIGGRGAGRTARSGRSRPMFWPPPRGSFTPIPGHFVTPLEPHVAGSSYAAESTNWSGQISAGTTYSGIHADWVVPTVQPTQYGGVSATWIGIDGGSQLAQLNHSDRHAQLTDSGSRRTPPGTSSTRHRRSRSAESPRATHMTASITQDSREQLDRSPSPISPRGSSSVTPAHLQRPRLIQPNGSRSCPPSAGAAQPTLANFGSSRSPT